MPTITTKDGAKIFYKDSEHSAMCRQMYWRTRIQSSSA
jgi:hypothetical protein